MRGIAREQHAHFPLAEQGREPRLVARPETTFLVTNMMRSVLNEGTAASARGAGFTLDAAGKTGQSMDISKINNIPIAGHTGQGSITDITIRRLLTLQGAFTPTQIVSPMSYKRQNNTLSLPNHNNRIQISYTPMFGTNKNLSTALSTILKPGQWIQLIQRLGQIPEPTIPINPSKYALKR